MHVTGRNVNDVFTDAMWYMRALGDDCLESSRNGPVLVAPGPVLSTYLRPWERVLFDARRDCNPVFHLMEAIWMLAGQQDVEWLSQFNSNISRYADDGVMNGAYGFRWRSQFGGIDQIRYVVATLRNDPNSRRAVINMWDPAQDINPDWKDVPCNTTIYFDLRGGKLNMTVCCRSNDAIWGCYGANVVHFSMLQEYIAAFLQRPIGVYRQFSNNFHIYTELALWKEYKLMPPIFTQAYTHDVSGPHEDPFTVPLVDSSEKPGVFRDDCYRLLAGEPCKSAFMTQVAEPLRDAYLARKAGDKTSMMHFQTRTRYCDWDRAFRQWVARRENNDVSE